MSPAIFGSRPIGETFAENVDVIKGRTIETNLFQLTGNIKKQTYGITLEINEIKGDKAQTQIKDFHLTLSAVKKMSRKATSKIEDSFACTTKDNKKIRVKTILVSKSKIKSKIESEIRNMTRGIAISRINTLTYDQLIDDLINLNFQRLVKSPLDKIYPLKTCQIRYVGMENNVRTKAVEAPKIEMLEQETQEEEKPKARKIKPKQEEQVQEQQEVVEVAPVEE